MGKRRIKIAVRGGEVPQDRMVPAWTSDGFNTRMRRMDSCRMSEVTPAAPLVPATGEVLSRIKAVVHNLRHMNLNKRDVNGVCTRRHFKLCFRGL